MIFRVQDLAAAALVAGCMLVPQAVLGQDTHTLRATNFASPTGGFGKMIETYAREVEEASDGRLIFEVYHSSSLGPYNKQHDLIRSGVADIGFILVDAIPGRYPKSDLLALPNAIRNSNVAGGNTELVMKIAPDHIYDEYDGMRVLWVAAVPGRDVYTKDTPIRSLEDLKGLKLTSSTKPVRKMLQTLGAEPITLASGEIADALHKNTIEGLHVQPGGVWALKLGEMLKYRTPLVTTNSVIAFTINEDSYARLPDDLKSVIDGLGGAESAVRYSVVYQEDSQELVEYFADLEIERITPDPGLIEEVNRISDAYAEEVLSGLDDPELRAFYDLVRATDEAGN